MALQGPDSIKWNEGGYITSLVLRYYVNPTNIQFSTIDNYRMMCYELLDYQKDSIASDYAVTVSINDNTLDVVDALIEACTDAYALLEEYAGFVDHACSFNEDIGVFNSFFTEAMLAEYPDPTKAPWYVAPVHYLMHLDLIYNTYGGDSDEIVKVAQGLSQQISPAVGTKTALEDFQSTFKDFIDSVYGDSGTITATIETVKEKVEASFATTLAIPGRTSAHAVTTFESCVTDDDCMGAFTCQGGWCKFKGAIAARGETDELCSDLLLAGGTEAVAYEQYLQTIENRYEKEGVEEGWEESVEWALSYAVNKYLLPAKCDPATEIANGPDYYGFSYLPLCKEALSETTYEEYVDEIYALSESRGDPTYGWFVKAVDETSAGYSCDGRDEYSRSPHAESAGGGEYS